MAEIDGKSISHKILDRLRSQAQRLQVKPRLVVMMVGTNPATVKYVERKGQACKYVGIDFYLHKFPNDVPTGQLVAEIERAQMSADAVIVQLPLPKSLDQGAVLDAIKVNKDADCLSSTAIGRVLRGSAKILPPTVAAVMEILNMKRVNLKGKSVVVVGQGELVGKPLAALFANQPVTLTVCGEGTKDLASHTKKADVLISGTGVPHLIRANMVKKGTVVIDAGVKVVKGKVVGDVDWKKIVNKAKLVTPTPGGLGPITVAKLLENVITLAQP